MPVSDTNGKNCYNVTIISTFYNLPCFIPAQIKLARLLLLLNYLINNNVTFKKGAKS